MNKTESYCYQKYKSSSNNSCVTKEKNIVGKNLLEGTYFDGNGIPKMIGITKDEYLEYKQLQQENKKLKECYCNRTDCFGRIKNSRNYDSLYQKYNKQLDNWNKLKEYIDTVFQWYSYGNNGPVEAKIAKEILNEVQKLERSDDNVGMENQ